MVCVFICIQIFPMRAAMALKPSVLDDAICTNISRPGFLAFAFDCSLFCRHIYALSYLDTAIDNLTAISI